MGPLNISTGSTPASAKVWNRARGRSPRSTARSSDMMKSVAAYAFARGHLSLLAVHPHRHGHDLARDALVDEAFGIDADLSSWRSRKRDPYGCDRSEKLLTMGTRDIDSARRG